MLKFTQSPRPNVHTYVATVNDFICNLHELRKLRTLLPLKPKILFPLCVRISSTYVRI